MQQEHRCRHHDGAEDHVVPAAPDLELRAPDPEVDDRRLRLIGLVGAPDAIHRIA